MSANIDLNLGNKNLLGHVLGISEQNIDIDSLDDAFTVAWNRQCDGD